MTPDTRRFLHCLLASLLINSLGLLLFGRLSLSTAIFHSDAQPHLRWVALALPHVALRKHKQPELPSVRHHAPKPAKPRTTPRKRLRPGAAVHTESPAPLAHSSGGRDAGAPAPALAVPEEPPALPLPTEKRVARLALPHPNATPLSAPITDSVNDVVAPSALPVATTETGHGAGGGAEGNGRGAGEGIGLGSSSGPGTGSDAGAPFGVGNGQAGDGAPRHIVYVLDISGSMISRIDRAEEELQRALSGLGPDETFNIVVFSDDARSFDTGMATATPDLIRRATFFLSTLQVTGGTDMEAAMTRALSCPDVNEVILLTDGVPTRGETNFKKLAKLIRERNRTHARISTVGLVGKNPDGTDDSFEAAQLLRQIAHDSGGDSKLVSLGDAAP